MKAHQIFGAVRLELAVLVISSIQVAQRILAPNHPVVDTYFAKQVTGDHLWLDNMNDQVVPNRFEAQKDYADSNFNLIPGKFAAAH